MAKPGRVKLRPSGEFSRFTDREDQQAQFRGYLNSPTEPPVLVYFGVGGAGKTWLLQKLRQQVPTGIPVAFLDFDMTAGGRRFLDDPAAGLYEIRSQFGQETPRFDLAYGMLRHKQGVLEEPAFKGSGPLGVAWDLVAELAQDAHKSVPGVGLVLGKLAHPLRERIKGTAFERILAQSTGNDFVLALRSQTTQEIGNHLVEYLADDLRENLPPAFNRAVRAVLFFDTFEAVYQGFLNTEHQRFREQWIRDVASNFDFALTVIAGQNRLNWEDLDPRWSEYLNQQTVGGLSENDARSFLAACGIASAALQDAILATSRQPGDGYHCFSLGLCADIVYAERRGGHEPEPRSLQLGPGDWEELARRFLKSLGSEPTRRWIERLAMTPRFDEAAARKAFSAEHSAAQDVEWETLPDFTFVEPMVMPWFSIRAEMRRALQNQPSTQEHVAGDHGWWRDYWKTRSQSVADSFASLSWYHHYRLDVRSAVEAWAGLADAAVEAVPQRMQEHFSLMGWWDPVGLLERPVVSDETAFACCELAGRMMVASLGNRSANVRLAIECYQAALGFYSEKDATSEWVAAQGGLGAALLVLPTGDRAENLRLAMECFRAIGPYAGEGMDPDDFAGLQGLLGLGWLQLPTGNRVENLGRAMECLRAALPVFEKTSPDNWALAQNSLGTAWLALPAGDRADNVRHAMECFTASLRVVTESEHPQHWALTQGGLGAAWCELPAADWHERSGNFARAAECFDAALRIFTGENFPMEWARIQTGLGGMWLEQPPAMRSENLPKAIAHFQAALGRLNEQELPQDWASAQRGLGRAWLLLPAPDRSPNLRQAIEHFDAALRVFDERSYPTFWAAVQEDLGDAWFALPGQDRRENLQRAFTCYQAVKRVYTEADRPRDWARIERDLGRVWLATPAGPDAESPRQAIACFQAALRVFTEQADRAIWASIQDDLGDAWFGLSADAGNLPRAIECYQDASRIYTEQEVPATWARLQLNTGIARLTLARLGYTDELRGAIASFQDALRVYTGQAYPLQHASASEYLQSALDLITEPRP